MTEWTPTGLYEAQKRGSTGPPSPRQLQVLALVADGLTNKEIASRLGIGDRTVKQHVDKLRIKLAVRFKRELIPLAREWEEQG